jgi:hypothetical protein
MPTLPLPLGGAADWSQVVTIDLEKLPEEFRLQRLVFKAAQRAFELLQEQFKGQREYLLFQLVRLVEEFLASNKIDIPSLFHQDPLRKRILFSLHIDQITQHLMKYVVEQNTLKLEPVFDGERPIGSTRDMRTWYTTRIAEPTQRCQVSHIVVDSGWEKYAANVVEAHPRWPPGSRTTTWVSHSVPVEWVQAQIHPRLSGALRVGQDPGAGNQGCGFTAGPGQARALAQWVTQ